MYNKTTVYYLIVVITTIIFSSCSLLNFGGDENKVSQTTGWKYGSEEYKTIENKRINSAINEGPGLVFIAGGTFVMGQQTEDLFYSWDSEKRRVTVSSYYIDKAEISNIQWREYVDWVNNIYPEGSEVRENVLPDTLVWREELGFNDPYIDTYFRMAAFNDFPVVGISWEQAEAFCRWRTDRVNEWILIENGFIMFNPDQSEADHFTTEGYLDGSYQGVASGVEGVEKVTKSDGILLGEYRLPTEAEWEYAAIGILESSDGETLGEQKIYPWSGDQLRTTDARRGISPIQANFVRGRGDYKGFAGMPNDGYEITAPVKSYTPNDYGLYCMAGNVNEWVKDVYRPTSSLDIEDFRPVRGNEFVYDRSEENIVIDKFGNRVYKNRINKSNVKDGEYTTQISDDWTGEQAKQLKTEDMYTAGEFGARINDDMRVYKGGSWKDRAYWLSIGTRRFLKQTDSKCDIGFRCVMDFDGDSYGL